MYDDTVYERFANLRTVTRTQTNIRLFLDEPNKRTNKFTNYVSSILEGTMEVFTRPQIQASWCDDGPLFMLPWDVGDMPSEGRSELGTIKLTGNPNLLTTGVIRQNIPGLPYPATLDAAVYQVFEIPGYGKLHNKYPVIITATVDAIPPFNALAACRCSYLFDEEGQMRGVIGGRSLTLMGPA